MKARLYWMLAAIVVLSIASWAQAAEKNDRQPARERLVGTWRLVRLDEPGANGKVHRITDAKGSLIYTPDGRMSVQVMYANADAPSSDYSQGGYEGSFGRYTVNEASQTVTHYVEGANVRTLLSKCLPRKYEFSGGHLILKSTRPDEHWSVTWERN